MQTLTILANFIGSHILIVFGLLFLFGAFRLHKKNKARPEEHELEKNIDDIGKS
jgi:putative Mn2+ efflux pump MntP